MLTVWTICWGKKYPEYYVRRLQKSVAENLTHEHRFVCISDREIDGVLTMPFPEDWPGWWSKIGLFKPGVATAKNIWFDLDVVITGSIDYIVDDYKDRLIAAPSNWAASGHGGIQSSVMFWNDSAMSQMIYHLYDPHDPRYGNWPPTTANGAVWGDQEWYTILRDRGDIVVTPITEGIYSYKYHCRSGLPSDARIVVFHGDPKPADVREPWFVW